MTKPWHFHVAAFDEMTAAAQWYEQREPGLGDDFLARIDAALTELEAMPSIATALRGVPEHEGVRRWVVARFPYQIIWAELADEYRILAIAHLRREPGYWLGRLDE